MTHNHLVPGSSPGGTTLKTPLLEGFFVSMTSIFFFVFLIKSSIESQNPKAIQVYIKRYHPFNSKF